MAIPLVTQLRFTRSEFVRCLNGVSAEDGVRRIKPMNSISWIIGHLAGQEHYLWIEAAQNKNIAPELYSLAGFGSQPNTPPLNEMWATWRNITQTADEYLDKLSMDDLDSQLILNGKPLREDVGKCLLRNIYHYWFHIGEGHAVRQMLDHGDLPQFVGDLSEVHYR